MENKDEPRNLHAGSKTQSETLDITEMIERHKCAKEYLRLEDCLVENNRNWSKCRAEIKELKICSVNTNRSGA